MQVIQFSSEGETVRGELVRPAGSGPFPGVVLTHGLLSARQEFGRYSQWLAELGFVALTFDLRGHGASDGTRGLVSQPRGVADIQAALEFLAIQPKVDAGRLALVGHSLGAAFSICAAAHSAAAAGNPRVRAVVAIAPPASIRRELRSGEGALYAAAYRAGQVYQRLTGKPLYFPYRVRERDIFHHRAAREAAQDQKFLARTVPHPVARTLLHEQDTLPCAERVQVPVLVLTGEHDHVVSTSHLVYERLAGPKDFRRLSDCGHSIMTDGHCQENFQHVARWLQEHLVKHASRTKSN